MLSDEEKQTIEYLKARLYGNEGCKFIDVAQNDLRIFLKLVEKQSEENKNLEDELNKYIVKMTDEQYGRLVDIIRDETNKSWVDKIKAKIEEYKKQIEKMEKDDIGKGFTLGKEWSDLKAKVEFGQSLLEKE